MTTQHARRIAAVLTLLIASAACGGGEATTTQTTQAPLVRPACVVRTLGQNYGQCLAEYKDQIEGFLDGAELAQSAVDKERLSKLSERLQAFRDDLRTRNLDDMALANRIDELMRLRPWRNAPSPVVDDLRLLRISDDVANAASMRAALRALMALI